MWTYKLLYSWFIFCIQLNKYEDKTCYFASNGRILSVCVCQERYSLNELYCNVLWYFKRLHLTQKTKLKMKSAYLTHSSQLLSAVIAAVCPTRSFCQICQTSRRLRRSGRFCNVRVFPPLVGLGGASGRGRARSTDACSVCRPRARAETAEHPQKERQTEIRVFLFSFLCCQVTTEQGEEELWHFIWVKWGIPV